MINKPETNPINEDDFDEKAIERIAKEITLPALAREAKEVDEETTNVIREITNDSIATVVGKRMPIKAERITEEIITRLNDNHNKIGQLFMQKKVLNQQGRLFKRLMELAMGIRVVKKVKGQPVIYDLPPDKEVIWRLLSYIDGSKANTIIKATKTEKSNSIDEELGG